MRRSPCLLPFGGAIASLVLAACGGGAATPTAVPPSPAPTARPSPTAAPAVASPTAPTATAPAPRVTAAPPGPTPTPAPTVSPPPSARRGGLLQLRGIVPLVTWDTYDARGRGDFYVTAPLLNNLIWVDPYGDGRAVVGDVAERWQVSQDGRVLTFTLRRGVQFHDGTPLTSKDVVYNLERAWKPRSPTMTLFRGRFAPIAGIEAPDESTVRITLSVPRTSS